MNFDERRYRPMNTADIFDEAFDLYKKNFALFLGVVAAVLVPLLVFINYYDYTWNQSFLQQLGGAVLEFDFTRSFGLLWEWVQNCYILLPIYFVLITLLGGAITSAVSARYLNQPITILGAYRAAVARWLPLLSSMVLFDILFVVCLLLCLFPVFFPAVLFLFVAHAAVLEGKAGFRALGRSKALVAGHGGRLFGSLLLLLALYWTVGFAIEEPISLIADRVVSSSLPFLPALATHQQLADQIASYLTSLLVLPFIATLATVLYYDLRIRKEGYDMEILAGSLGYPSVEMASVRPFGAAPAQLRPLRINPQAIRKGRK